MTGVPVTGGRLGWRDTGCAVSRLLAGAIACLRPMSSPRAAVRLLRATRNGGRQDDDDEGGSPGAEVAGATGRSSAADVRRARHRGNLGWRDGSAVSTFSGGPEIRKFGGRWGC